MKMPMLGRSGAPLLWGIGQAFNVISFPIMVMSGVTAYCISSSMSGMFSIWGVALVASALLMMLVAAGAISGLTVGIRDRRGRKGLTDIHRL